MTINLDELREKISDTDAKLLSLLAERLRFTQQVAETKIATHKDVRDPKREEQLLVSLVKQGSKLGLDPHYVTNIFHVIIENSVLNQQALLAERANPEHSQPLNRVAFLGNPGSYSYLATQRYFARRPGELHEMGFKTFKAVLEKVESNEADYAVLPIENTTSGSINEVYDLLQHTSLSIVGEITQPVKHALLTKNQKDISNIKQVYGHPQALMQCRVFIDSLDDVKKVPCDSTSAAMQLVSESERDDIAAIGSIEGGNFYNLNAIKQDLANQQENHTRFIVVSRKAVKVPIQIPAKTTLVMSTIQKPGALVDALIVLKDNQINMTKLESRPITGNPWEEMFYLDVEGNTSDGPMQQALEDLKGITRYLKVLGCYPVEDITHTKVPVFKALSE
ncbi:prephenate dehydratase [Paraneptunicella aestuarii]|uniref:prephenate dehydratase n=1 Tax=Paraneptunicella aestuarii TaxID=2831148 RepID=UPI001E38EAE6|nr:prephenate dehydratase [Paraneptunicella aestuarii]UAA40129.1 prephenate dehydratase [Paraneptunicella aestuarii]